MSCSFIHEAKDLEPHPKGAFTKLNSFVRGLTVPTAKVSIAVQIPDELTDVHIWPFLITAYRCTANL